MTSDEARTTKYEPRRFLPLWVFLLIAANIFLAVFGLFLLKTSPYTGIYLDSGDKRTGLVDVDPDSPAALAGARTGDRLLDVNGMGLPKAAFAIDPDVLSTRREVALFWEAQERLHANIAIGKPLTLSLSRGGRAFEVSLVPVPFPGGAFLKRCDFFFLLLLWMALPWLVLRKKQTEAAVAFFFFTSFLCLSDLCCSFVVRDLSFPPLPFQLVGWRP